MGVTETEARQACQNTQDFVLAEGDGISIPTDLSGVVLRFDTRFISAVALLAQGGELPKEVQQYAVSIQTYMDPIRWQLPAVTGDNAPQVVTDIGSLRGRCGAFLASTPGLQSSTAVLDQVIAVVMQLAPQNMGQFWSLISLVASLWVLFAGFKWNDGRKATQGERIGMWAALMVIAWACRTFIS